jgi:SAM-dependent methyltransferase
MGAGLRVLRKGLRRVVRAIDTVPAARDALLPIVFVALYALLGNEFDFAGKTVGAEIFGGALAAFFGYLVSSRIRVRGFHKGIKVIREIADEATLSPGRPLYVEMIADRLNEAKSIVKGFQSDTYKVGSPEQLQGWIGTFFKLADGNYLGVDSHSPSRYWLEYAWFLEAHANSLRKRREDKKPTKDVRILSVDKKQLDDDWFNEETRSDYKRFVEWHTENEVELRTISTSDLAEIREAHQLEIADDVALWNRFAVLFTGQDGREDEAVGLRLRVRNDLGRVPEYIALGEFMEEVKEKSNLLKDAPPGVEMGDAALIDRWDDYVGQEVRWLENGPYRKFMDEILSPDGAIFDAAAGSGTDSVELLSLGYSVTSNEVDPRLHRRATQLAEKRGVPLKLEISRWEDLTIAGLQRFETVLVMGNSLCLVSSRELRIRALKNFYRVLLPGGRLVIDERNFESMRERREDILKEPLKNWVKEGQDVMYPGSELTGYPSAIEDSVVWWSFFSNVPPVKTSDEIQERAKNFHPLELYAFQHGELYHELESIGFRVHKVYADLKGVPGSSSGMPPHDTVRDARFLTYIAEKPQR